MEGEDKKDGEERGRGRGVMMEGEETFVHICWNYLAWMGCWGTWFRGQFLILQNLPKQNHGLPKLDTRSG